MGVSSLPARQTPASILRSACVTIPRPDRSFARNEPAYDAEPGAGHVYVPHPSMYPSLHSPAYRAPSGNTAHPRPCRRPILHSPSYRSNPSFVDAGPDDAASTWRPRPCRRPCDTSPAYQRRPQGNAAATRPSAGNTPSSARPASVGPRFEPRESPSFEKSSDTSNPASLSHGYGYEANAPAGSGTTPSTVYRDAGGIRACSSSAARTTAPTPHPSGR